MKKKLFALALILLVMIHVAMLSVVAEPSEIPVYAGVGNYTASLEADKATGDVPEIFGTAAADGMVWTDKSVKVNGADFEVTLSALSQEFLSVKASENTDSTPADVVMILDFSSSMQSNTLTLDGDKNATRTKAMIKSVNAAMELIMNANSKNRVVVYGYNSEYSCIFPLGHYTNSAWNDKSVWSSSGTNAGAGKYFDYSVSSGKGKASTAAGLMKDGTAFSNTMSTSTGTFTQYGVVAGISSLIASIESEEHTVDRLPFVFLFTDGAPGIASKNWHSNTPNSQNKVSNQNERAALSILSSMYMKNRLDEAYDTYNGKDTNVEWFNIGLSVGTDARGVAFMDPVTVETVNNSTNTSVLSYINNYTSGDYSDYSAYASDYIYAEEYVFFASTGEALENAFVDFGKLVEESSKEIKVPVINVEGEAAATGLVFTDTLGKGMKLDAPTLWLDDTNSITPTVQVQGGKTVYHYEGYQMKATLSHNAEGQKVLTWEIPSNEVAICTYEDRADFTSGKYLVKDPRRLVYQVKVEDPAAYAGEALYSNGFDESKRPLAYATFGVAEDNSYYYDVTVDSLGNFQSSVLKDSVFSGILKEKNITETAAYTLAYAPEEKQGYTLVTAKLGNNGRLKGVAHVSKQGSAEKIRAGETMEFTIRVANKSNSALNHPVVKDQLPDGLTYVAGSAVGGSVAESGKVLTFTIPQIAAQGEATITYQVAVTDAAVDGTVYNNKAYLEVIDNVTVIDPDQAEAEVTVENRYAVTYSWSGDFPQGITLPQNHETYGTGDRYSVDNFYHDATRIEKKDAYGNLTDYWLFSGWADPYNGEMGKEDVLIEGIWTHYTVQVTPHRVYYRWQGEAPEGVMPPSDADSYYPNQPYEVDTTYVSGAEIPTYDDYLNQNGTWIFSGWADPNHGLMGDADVEIIGKWNFVPMAVPSYKVTYSWSGVEPPDHIPPVDGSTYVSGQRYSVDSVYSAGMSLPEKDVYGNVVGVYSFSGWQDPNHGTMGNGDVLIEGVWTYTPREVPAYKITYEWTGEIPAGVTLPTDGNTYVPNQPYEVDEEFKNTTTLDTKDAYGNVTGIYSFSGWQDPNSGVMGNADVWIEGVWTYTPREVPAYKITYEWTGEIPAGVTLPTDGNTYVPNQPYEVDEEFKNTTALDTKDAYGNVTGRYSFSGWQDPNSGVMGNADVLIMGEWVYTPEEAPEIPEEELPEEELPEEELPEEEIPQEEIPEEETPSEDEVPSEEETPFEEEPSKDEETLDSENNEEKPSDSERPHTGEQNDLALWYGMAISALLALGVLSILKRKLQ
ncbi:MAG: DUF11 domain-containing protein [Clostridia bacterium]|nr:DUF11 domain-containing protein [Clostridia bacterium]